MTTWRNGRASGNFLPSSSIFGQSKSLFYGTRAETLNGQEVRYPPTSFHARQIGQRVFVERREKRIERPRQNAPQRADWQNAAGVFLQVEALDDAEVGLGLAHNLSNVDAGRVAREGYAPAPARGGLHERV